MTISFESRFVTELHAHVLAHLDLGPDAASLFRSQPYIPSWVAPMTDAYRASSGRLSVQFIGLWAQDHEHAERGVHQATASSLSDPPGRALCEWLVTAMRAEKERVYAQWLDTAEARYERVMDASTVLIEPLQLLRDALWQGTDSKPPPLTVLHAPSMGRQARAMSLKSAPDKRRVVATSLDEEWEHVLCQIFHEEVHPVSDPEVYARLGTDSTRSRDTNAHGAGFSIHQAVEKAAVELGDVVMRRALPEQLPAYQSWCARFGLM